MIKNLRNVNVKDLELAKINILVGPNGSGKSVLMDTLSMTKDDFISGIWRCNYAEFNSSDFAKPVSARCLDSDNFIVQWNKHMYDDMSSQLTFLSRLQDADPNVKGVGTYSINNYMTVKVNINGSDYTLEELSDGMLRMLSLNMLINMCESSKRALFIENPDVGLSATWQRVVAMWILQSRVFDQYFISSYSPEFLDAFTDDFRKGNAAVLAFYGPANVKRLRSDDVVYRMSDWRLGDICR